VKKEAGFSSSFCLGHAGAACYTERRETKIEVRKVVAFTGFIADGQLGWLDPVKTTANRRGHL
jgi:hypothetical protein